MNAQSDSTTVASVLRRCGRTTRPYADLALQCLRIAPGSATRRIGTWTYVRQQLFFATARQRRAHIAVNPFTGNMNYRAAQEQGRGRDFWVRHIVVLNCAKLILSSTIRRRLARRI